MFNKFKIATVRRGAGFLGATVLLAGLALTAGAASNRVRVGITNGSSYDIYHLYVSSTGNNSWGRDLLGDAVLGTGDSVAVTAVPGKYDLKLVDEDLDVCTVMGLDLYSDASWRITNRWLLSCEFH
jgi:hypothetical protein